jgi:ribosomal protein S12 methylthiotransferase
MRVGIVTLGCDKNTVDNEYLAGLLAGQGCEIVTGDWGDLHVDAAVVTTCGFIGSAKQQSVDAIIELAESKRETGNPARLFVAGCLAQRYADDILAEVPEIDALLGVGQFNKIAQLIMDTKPALSRRAIEDVPRVDIYQFMERKKLDDKPYAFVKLADGCDHACTFCSIPSMKGKLRSVPPEILVQEAKNLIDQGVRELNLVAQDLADYGRDRWKDYRLPELLRDLNAIEGDFWIRCFYLYPGGINDRVLDVLANTPKVVPYVDMPLQHLDTGVLHRMKRPYRDVNTVKLVEKMRAAVPGLVMRTTMIVGFPGETDAEHERMLELVEEMRFERLGAFQYSQEEDTPAGVMPDQVPEEVKQERWEALMEVQSAIHGEHSASRVGEHTRVLVEGYDTEFEAYATRSPGEAPEVDGMVYVQSETPLKPGDFVDVEITSAEVFDLFAIPV